MTIPQSRRRHPLRVKRPGAAALFHAKALEAPGILLQRPRSCAEARGRADDREIVRQAEAIIAGRYNEPLTAQSIAAEPYVSRSRLCAAFKRERGFGVAIAFGKSGCKRRQTC